jgi:Fic family protein
MTYVNMIKCQKDYIILLFLDESIIQIIPIYRDVRRIQKGMKEYQILIIISYNQIVQSHIFSYHILSNRNVTIITTLLRFIHQKYKMRSKLISIILLHFFFNIFFFYFFFNEGLSQ